MPENMNPISRRYFLVLLVLIVAGCATSPPNNVIDRISEDELARISPKSVAALTLDEIVRLSQSGQTADQIIEKIKATDSQYELTPSQSVALSQQGVDSRVLDYIHSSHELAWRNSLADEINKREKEKREVQDKLKQQQLEQRRVQDPFCRGYHGFYPYGYGAFGSRHGPRFGLGAGYIWPRYCW